MSRRPGTLRRRALVPVALAALCLSSACSAPADPPSSDGTAVSATGADASRSPVAELQAGTTHLLVERVHLTAAARAATAADELEDARSALDGVSVALADLLGATYSGAREPLLTALRAGDQRTVEHAAAVRTGDRRAVAGALAAASTAQDGLATVVRRVVPQLPAALVGERLRDDLAAQLAVGGDDPYALLRTAADRAPGTARLLAGGIAADRDLGPSGSRAAGLRADLTAALTSHLLLACAVAREDGTPRSASAERALAADGERLTDLLGEAYPELRAPFARAWSAHLDRVVALARAGAESELPRRALLASSPALGTVLAQHVGGLPAATAAVELEPMLAALADALQAGPRRASAALLEATATAPAVAALLAAAIAEDRRYA